MKLTVYDESPGTSLPMSVIGWIRQDLQEPSPEHDQNNQCTIAAREGFTIHAIMRGINLVLLRSWETIRGDELPGRGSHSWGHYRTVDEAVAEMYDAHAREQARKRMGGG